MLLARRPLHRRLTALAVVAAGALSLSGCEKPEPRVTVFSGSESLNLEPACWNPEDAAAGEECLPSDARTLEVSPGETIGISVDPDVAEAGFIVQVNDTPLFREPVTDSYYRFSLQQQDFLALAEQNPGGDGSALLRVSAVTGEGDQLQARGVWAVRLAPS